MRSRARAGSPSPSPRPSGFARWMLVAGIVHHRVLRDPARSSRPWIAPYGFAQSSADGERFPKAGAAERRPLVRHRPAVLRRPVPGDLGRPDRDRGGGALDRVLRRHRRARWAWSRATSAAGWTASLVLIMDALFAFPSFLLAIVFSFLLTDIFGGSVHRAWRCRSRLIYIPQYFRVVRNTTVSAKEATYVEAARAIGASDGVIMRRYLFGNVVQSVPVLGHPERRRRHPHPGRAWASSVSASSRPRRRVGARPQPRARRRRLRHLVDRPLPGPGDRAPGHRADPGGRGPQRDPQPDPAARAGCCRSSCRPARPRPTERSR